MILVACVDKNNGIMFNNRRQSRDKELIKRIVSMNKKVWINSFSKELFEGYSIVCVDDDFMNKCNSDDICFVENVSLSEVVNKADKIILYNWNREYPADRYLDVSLGEWQQVYESEFVGNSHDKITEKIYVRRGK